MFLKGNVLVFLQFLYFSTIIFFFIIYIYIAPKVGVRLYSFSNVFFALVYLIVVIPGYHISAGIADSVIFDNFYRGFDFDLYLIYLATAVMVPIGILFGNAIVGGKYIAVQLHRRFELRWKISVFVCIVYGVLFFVWLPEVPLYKLFQGSSLLDLAYSRLFITHGFVDLNPPLPFRYWRNILQVYVVVLFIIFLVTEKKMGRNIRYFRLLIFFIFTSWCLFFTLEKASFAYFLFSIFLVFSIIKHGRFINTLRYKDVLKFKGFVFIGIFFLFILLMYSFFMGSVDVMGPFSRMLRQTSSNYLQIQYVRDLGYSGVGGLGSIVFNYLGAEKVVDFSKIAIIDIYPSKHSSELSGSAGGMFATNIYFMFGWVSLPLTFLYLVGLGIFDKIFCNSAFNQKNVNSSPVLISFYVIYCSWYPMYALSTPLKIFSLNFIFSPQLIIFLIFMSIFVTPKVNS